MDSILGMRGIVLSSLVLIGFAGLIFSVSAQSSAIPDWVKNNAKWWSEGQITETDYLSGIQYLINHGMIVIPITEVTATKVNLSDDQRAQSIVVHMNGEIFDKGVTYYTFSEFQHLSSAVRTSSVVGPIATPTSPEFILLGLPSKDKAKLYQLVDQFVNPSRPPGQYAIDVDIMAGDGSIIQTWKYGACSLGDYVTYLDSSKEYYRYSGTDDSEIRELFYWKCAGFRLTVP